MRELIVPVAIAVWTAAGALLVALGRAAASGEALQSRLFREWQARRGAAGGERETAAGRPAVDPVQRAA